MRRRKRVPGRGLLGELPEDALGGGARATMIGRGAVLVEGQSGVVELGGSCVRLKTGRGILTVLGEGLCIGELSSDAAMIRGREITTLTYGRAGQNGE